MMFLTGNSHQLSVMGIVSDSSTGKPLKYVLIVNQNTGARSTTNQKGEYSIAAQTNDKLAFSLQGYNLKIVTVSGSTQNVTMSVKAGEVIAREEDGGHRSQIRFIALLGVILCFSHAT